MRDTELTIADLNGIRGFWEKHLGVPCVIAGGAVRDVMLGQEPKDVDIFVMGEGLTDESVEDAITEMVVNDAVQVDVCEGEYEGEYLVGSYTTKGYHIRQQLMVTGHKDLNSLLDSFDWNVSLFGIDTDGKPVTRMSIDAIGPGQLLKLQRVTNPFSNLARGFRFAERYGMIIYWKSELEIKRAIHKLQSEKLKEMTSE